MKRYKYQYQILQVIPDRVTGEFVNIGIVFYSKEEKYLRWSFLEKFNRVVNFFPEFKWDFLPQRFEGLEEILSRIKTTLIGLELSEMPESVAQITAAFMTPNDSTFIFSKCENGIAPNLDKMFDYLKIRLIPRNDSGLAHSGNQKNIWIDTYRGNYSIQNKFLGEVRSLAPLTECHLVLEKEDRQSYSAIA